MLILTLDKEHSDPDLVKAIVHYNEKNGSIDRDAPIEFLTQHEINMVNRDGAFRPNLYCMLLSSKFAEGIEQENIFMTNSYKYAFEETKGKGLNNACI